MIYRNKSNMECVEQRFSNYNYAGINVSIKNQKGTLCSARNTQCSEFFSWIQFRVRYLESIITNI